MNELGSAQHLVDNLFLVALFGLINFFYLPLNWYQSRRATAFSIASPWDKKIPFLPIFFIPYIFSLMSIIFGPAVLATLFPPEQFLPIILSLLLTQIICFAIWIIRPYKMQKSEKILQTSHPFLIQLIVNYGEKFGNYNAFPSAHVALITVICLWLSLFFPTWAPLLLIFIGVNMGSILFTHQHYLYDAISGFLLAVSVTFVIYLVV